MTASDGFWYETEIWTDANLCVLQKSQEKNSNCTQEQFKYKPRPKFN